MNYIAARRLITYFIFMGLCLSYWACSQSGSPTEPAPPTTPSDPDSSDDPDNADANASEDPSTAGQDETLISLLTPPQQFPQLTSCAQYLPLFDLHDLTERFKLDGKNDEWQELQAQHIDAEQDGWLKQLDIQKLWLGHTIDKDARNLIVGSLYIEGLKNIISRQDWAIEMEWGDFIAARQNTQNPDTMISQKRWYQFRQSGIYEYRNGQWLNISHPPGAFADFKIKDNIIEWQIYARELEAIVNRPIWWLRIRSLIKEQEDDLTGMQLYPSQAGDANLVWELKRCRSESSHLQPMFFYQMAEKSIDENTKERAFDLIRSAYEEAMQLLGWPKIATQAINLRVLSRSSTFHDLDGQIKMVPQLNASLGVELVIDTATTNALERRTYESLYLNMTEQFLRFILQSQRNHYHQLDLDLITAALQHQLQKTLFGKHQHLIYTYDKTHDFLEYQQPQQVIPLLDRYKRLTEPFDSEAERLHYLKITQSKKESLAWLVAQLIPEASLFKSWLLFKDLHTQSWPSQLEQLAGPWIKDLMRGWYFDTTYVSSYGPQQLVDDDFDGLSNYLEHEIGSQQDNPDSDGDGWNDYAEFIHGTSPTSEAQHPQGIVPDNLFGDWQELLPTKLHLQNRAISPECPEAARIKTYAALAQKTQLLVASLAQGRWQKSPPLSLEVQIESQNYPKETWIVRATAGSHNLEIYEPGTQNDKLVAIQPMALPFGIYANEFVLPFESLGSELIFDRARLVKIRISTILENNKRTLCDQTPWFFPLVHR